MKMDIDQVIEKLNKNDITVYNYKENDKLCGYELSTYTNLGVNQILLIDFRDSKMNPKNAKHFISLFNQRVNDIDINEEIKIYTNDNNYMKAIGIARGVKDFEEWKSNLQNIFPEQDSKTAQQRQLEQVVDKFISAINEIENILELMPIKGLKSNHCQRTAIQNQVNELSQYVNGIKLEDFIPNEYSGNFKLSYSN